MRCNRRVDGRPGVPYKYLRDYSKEMNHEVSTARLRRFADELWRRECRDGDSAQGGCAYACQGTDRKIARMLQAGRCQGPAWQRAAEIPRRMQKGQELIAQYWRLLQAAAILLLKSGKIGDPGWTRTTDLQLRRLLLYPAELRGHRRNGGADWRSGATKSSVMPGLVPGIHVFLS